jgi:Trk K+ transport system NAD-binding subunit
MSTHPSPPGDAPAPGRLRFDDVSVEAFPNSHCEAKVSLTPPTGISVSRTVSGPNTLEGRLRAAAQATLDAASAATGTDVSLELSGAKAVKAFDASIVIVAIRATADGRRYRLTGCFASEPDEAARGAALAALDAINRVLSPFLE